MKKIGSGLRILAYIIDSVIILIFSFICAMFFGLSFSLDLGNPTLVAFFIAVVALLYNFSELFNNKTFGKKRLRIEILKADGTDPNLRVLFFRYLIKNSFFILTLIFAITGIMAFFFISITLANLLIIGFLGTFFKNRQSLIDLITKTAVFELKSSVKTGEKSIRNGTCIVEDKSILVYSKTHESSNIITELKEGDQFTIDIETEFGRFFKVNLPTGQEGYILRNSKFSNI